MKLLIFDLDGTLVRLPIDYNSLRQSLKEYFKKYGLNLEFRPLLKKIDYAISFVKKNFPEDQEKVKKDVKEILDKFELEGVKKAEIIENVRETLNSLKEMNFKLAILTSNGKKCAEKSLEKFKIKNYFNLILSREDCKPKPEPSGILKIMNKLNFKKENTIMVGDGLNDILAAKNAGVKFIGVLTGVGDLKTFKDNKVNYIKNLGDLIKALK